MNLQQPKSFTHSLCVFAICTRVGQSVGPARPRLLFAQFMNLWKRRAKYSYRFNVIYDENVHKILGNFHMTIVRSNSWTVCHFCQSIFVRSIYMALSCWERESKRFRCHSVSKQWTPFHFNHKTSCQFCSYSEERNALRQHDDRRPTLTSKTLKSISQIEFIWMIFRQFNYRFYSEIYLWEWERPLLVLALFEHARFQCSIFGGRIIFIASSMWWWSSMDRDGDRDRDNATSSTSHSRSERQSTWRRFQPMSFNLIVSGYANNSPFFLLLLLLSLDLYLDDAPLHLILIERAKPIILMRNKICGLS